MIGRLTNWFQELAPVMKVTVVGVAVVFLSGAVYLFAGPYGVLFAVGIAAGVALALFGFQLLLRYRVNKRKADFDSGLVDDIKSARAEIGGRFEQALEELKANRVDIYELPWYFYIGEPQSGKTFTIKTSGVDLPLGTQGISGAGGTRDCDFWFTNEAVILDTAGRLTLQDDEIIDREQWSAVLRFLGRCRPNCPINGVIVGIPCTSLLEDDADTIERKADAIQKRLKELQTALKIHFPVFLAILKTDLVLGFEPFFKRLPVLERKQLMGWANPNRFDQSYNPETFGKSFDEVVQALHRWRLKFLNDEPTSDAIDQFYIFPDEFKDLRQPIQQYLDKIFIRGPYGQAGFLRGYFFTSSLQEGRAIPHAIRSILGGIDEDRPAALDLDAVQARSTPFFVREFYMKKVFPEKGLLLRSDRSRLVNAVIRGTSLWGGAAVLLVGIVILILRIPTVGSKLSRPEALVTAIERNENPEKRSFEISSELGEKIEEWKNRPGSAPGALFEFFFPEPSRDSTLISSLETAYGYHLWRRHLGPFYARVFASMQGARSPESAGEPASIRAVGTWTDFERRSHSFSEIVSTVAADNQKETPIDPRTGAERFEALVRSAGLVDASDPKSVRYYEELEREYKRFLSLGGRAGPFLLASGGDGQPGVWTRLDASRESLTAFLDQVVDEGRLADGYGVEFGDAIRSWRRVLKAADRFQTAYEALLGETPREPDGTPIPHTALDKVRYDDLEAKWKSKFAVVRESWKELESSCRDAESGGRLEADLVKLKTQIDGFFDKLTGTLLADLKDPDATALRGKLESEKERIGERFARFRQRFLSRFDAVRHIVTLAAKATGEEQPGRGVEPPVRIADEVREIWGRLAFLDEAVNRDPEEITGEWSTPERRESDIVSFPARLEKKYGEYRDRIIKAVTAKSDHWKKSDLSALVDNVAAGAFTRLFAGVLDEYIGWAEQTETQPNRLAFFDWLKTAGDRDAQPTGLFPRRLDEAYLKSAYDEHVAHVNRLLAFVDGKSKAADAPKQDGKEAPAKAPESSYLRFEAFGINARDRLLGLMEQYERAYLGYWKSLVTRSTIWTPEHAYDPTSVGRKHWEEFQRDLNRGFGHTSIDYLANTVITTSVTATVKHVTVIPLERRRRASNHAWAVALEVFKEKNESVGNLANILIEFEGKLVANLDGKDPVKALSEVRRQRDLWLDSKMEDFRKKYALAGDLFTEKLLKLGQTGKAILAADSEKLFQEAWAGLSERWRDRIAGKFPFDGDRRISLARLAEKKVTCVEPDVLLQLLRPDGDIRKMFLRYWSCFPDADNPYGLEADAAKVAFLKASDQLRQLLFRKDSDEFRDVKYTVILPGDPGSPVRAEIAGGGRDVFSLQPFRVRFSSGPGAKAALLYENAAPIERTWTFGKGDPAAAFTGIEVQDRDRTPLEDGDVELVQKVEGPWSFLLFLRAFGTPVDDKQSLKAPVKPKTADRGLWFIREEIGKTDHQEGPVIVYFLVRLDVPLEPLPDWNRANAGN